MFYQLKFIVPLRESALIPALGSGSDLCIVAEEFDVVSGSEEGEIAVPRLVQSLEVGRQSLTLCCPHPSLLLGLLLVRLANCIGLDDGLLMEVLFLSRGHIEFDTKIVYKKRKLSNQCTGVGSL